MALTPSGRGAIPAITGNCDTPGSARPLVTWPPSHSTTPSPPKPDNPETRVNDSPLSPPDPAPIAEVDRENLAAARRTAGEFATASTTEAAAAAAGAAASSSAALISAKGAGADPGSADIEIRL